MFCNDERPKVKADYPEYSFAAIITELGQRWASADPDIKAKYEALFEQDKQRYDRVSFTSYIYIVLIIFNRAKVSRCICLLKLN